MTTDDLYLTKWGLKEIQLRPYQVEGIKWFIKCIRNSHGGILADEMGLGKTIQTICAVLSCKHIFQFNKYIIISSLSVISNWVYEFEKYTPNLKFLVYMGNKMHRSDMRTSVDWKADDIILITTYEYLIQDFVEISSIKFEVFFMDEGHRVKNKDSILYGKVNEMSIQYRFLLTGTPVQNNVDELYNLIKIVTPNYPNFKYTRQSFKDYLQSFLSNNSTDFHVGGILETNTILSELVLRRTKAEVLPHLPEKMEVLIFHGLTQLQKDLYRSFLVKDINVLNQIAEEHKVELNSDNRKLLNVLVQIRKCLLHPYLFNGIEKEPFELGEHIVDQSMKLQVLDKLLKYLIPLGHKMLIFSQMTKMIDIVQDYCFLRGFDYERLDGSVRSEERFSAITNFNANEGTKLFLLSTRAGGQGLNLVAADTVIFLDSDFNPQVDLQAMARIHRLGQQRPCRTIRLVTKNSVEEMIICRAQQKLQMTRKILGHEDQKKEEQKLNFREMLCYGLDKLFSDELDMHNMTLSNEFFTSILGDTNGDNYWQPVKSEIQCPDSENISNIDHMYLFEGVDYKPQACKRDLKVIDDIMSQLVIDSDKTMNMKANLTSTNTPGTSSKTSKKPERSQTKLSQKKKEMWEDNKYISRKIPMNNTDDETGDGADNTILTDETDLQINFVVGDVTNPVGDSSKLKIICHLVDNSGSWGSGGLFSTIDQINPEISIDYLKASEMEDLKLGDCHEWSLKSNINLVLLVAQSRDSSGRLSPIKLNHLETCFDTIAGHAIKTKASIHLTRLGYKTPQFNWYGIERLIEKHFTGKAIETYVYYFRRTLKRSYPIDSTKKLSEIYFKSILKNVIIHFDKSVNEQIKSVLQRHVYALDGQISNDELDSKITHVLLDDGQVSFDRHFSTDVHYLKLNWLVQSIKQNILLPEINFKV